MDLASNGTPQLPQWPPVPFPSSHWSWGFSAFLGKESGLSRLYRTSASTGIKTSPHRVSVWLRILGTSQDMSSLLSNGCLIMLC